MDDERSIREAVQEMLTLMGFETLAAQDGPEALGLMALNSEAIRLVVMDITMPGMDGREAFTRISADHPYARVILSSGYCEHEAIHSFEIRGLGGFIQKPYRMSDLVEVVEKAMGGPFIMSS